MTAPVAVPRTTPTARKMPDGYKTLVTFTSTPAVELWEIDITPPGMNGGDAIDQSTMHNARVHTKAPRKLITIEDVKFTCQYNPSVYTSLMNLINKKDTITVTFPDESTLAFYGFLRSFEPGGLQEGNKPTGTATIVATNVDPATGAEEAPVYTAPPAGAPAMAPEEETADAR